MAISYQMPIWPRWLWNTGLRCAPQPVILRGFAVCVGLTPFPYCETNKRTRFASLNRRSPDKNTFIEAEGCSLIHTPEAFGRRARLVCPTLTECWPRHGDGGSLKSTHRGFAGETFCSTAAGDLTLNPFDGLDAISLRVGPRS